jgi:allophanate hydrolase
MDPTVRAIVEGARRFSAIDMSKAEYRRAELARIIHEAMATVDALIVPTAPTVYTISEVLAEPLKLNSRLGVYTNFANLADLCALALPGGMRADELPAGITLLAPAWHDRALAQFGKRWQKHRFQNGHDTELGATSHGYVPSEEKRPDPPANTIRIAVVGAHLRGMPLNHQLTSRGAAFVEGTRTSMEYRIFALAGTKPPKPGLVRVAQGESGEAIEVELWDLPSGHFASFVVEIPAPLGIGSIKLADGRVVKGFICEPCGLIDAQDITSFAGWRAYLSSLQSADEVRK